MILAPIFLSLHFAMNHCFASVGEKMNEYLAISIKITIPLNVLTIGWEENILFSTMSPKLALPLQSWVTDLGSPELFSSL